MRTIAGGITAPKGFMANAVHCGIKKAKPDLALLLSAVPAVAAGVVTGNNVKAAPVIVSQRHLRHPRCRGIIVNSGNANCCNGSAGMKAAHRMAACLAQVLKIAPQEVLVASTGVIGEPFPVEKVTAAVPALVGGLDKSKHGFLARAIMTTDTFSKEIAVTTKIANTTVTIGGVAKGAGMICPTMATMLSFITTDAAIERRALREALKAAVACSFNSISVDGAMSTNDSVFIVANGAAQNTSIRKGTAGYRAFSLALGYVLKELAKKIVLDGEGATKFITILVKGARTYPEAKTIALLVANNPLVKTSFFGEDPNWGRIAAAAGAGNARFDQNSLDIYIGRTKVLSNGARTAARTAVLKRLYRKKSLSLTIDLKTGNKQAEVFTCDLSNDYIKLNVSYT